MDNGRIDPDVWAIGDASVIQDAAKLPATAQGIATFFPLTNIHLTFFLKLQIRKRNI